MGIVARWRRSLPATRWLFLFGLANVVLLNIALALAGGTPLRQLGVAHTLRLAKFLHRPTEDSWGPMQAAMVCLHAYPDRGLYATVFFGSLVKFQYPPTALLMTYPVLDGSLDGLLARLRLSRFEALNLVSWILLLVMALLLAVLLRRLVAEAAAVRGEAMARWEPALLGLIGAALALTYYPALWALALGQIQVWINALAVGLILAWVAGRRTTAGVLAGIMGLIKPQYGVLVLWALVRRQGRFALAAVATGAAGLILSIGLFGLKNHLDYLGVLSFIARHGEGYFANQSVNGLLNRALLNGPNLEWQADAFAPYHPVVHAGTVLSSLLLIGLALFWPVRRTSQGSVLDLGVAIVTSTVASPVAWEHHYAVLLPLYAILFATLYRTQASPGEWVVLGLSYALTSNFLPIFNRLAGTPFNCLQSYVFAGGLLALVLLYALRSRTPAAPVQRIAEPWIVRSRFRMQNRPVAGGTCGTSA